MTENIHPSYKLVSHPLCPYVQRAIIVLTEQAMPFERVDIDLAAKPDWFLEISPLGKVPALMTDRAVLFESQIIAEYLDETAPQSLHPTDALDRARHRSWIEAASHALNLIARLYNAPAPEPFQAAEAELRRLLHHVDGAITGPYFAGRRFHMVDGVWGTVFRYFDVIEREAGLASLTASPTLARWRSTVMARPSVKAAAPSDYPELLTRFLTARQSEISRLIRNRAARLAH